LTCTNAVSGQGRRKARGHGHDADGVLVFHRSHAGDVDVEVIGAMDRSSAGQFRNQILTLAKEHPRRSPFTWTTSR